MKRIVILLFLVGTAYGVTPPLISFSTGEISPPLEKRSDFEKYDSSCRTLENMFVLTQGPVMRRPGTKHIVTTPIVDPCVAPPDPTKIQIYTIEDLAKIGINPNYPLDGDYELMNNLDATVTETWNEGEGWSAIGIVWQGVGLVRDYKGAFAGNFDGRFHTIDGLYINMPNYSGHGLFYIVSGGTIENLILTNIDYRGSQSIAGFVHRVNSKDGAKGSYVWPGGPTIIRQCSVQGRIWPSYPTAGHMGGFVAYVSTGDYPVLIEKCYADVEILRMGAHRNTGGFVAYLLTGYTVGLDEDLTVRNCYAIGDQVGDAAPPPSTLPKYLGGFCANAGGHATKPLLYIENCYSTGRVPECNEAMNRGGFIGRDYYGNAIVTNSYWDEETSECDWSALGTGKTTAEMKQEATFVDWDFTDENDIWSIVEDVSYPTLQWETKEVPSFPYAIVSEVVRLISFEYAKDEAYILAFGDQYIGFYKEN